MFEQLVTKRAETQPGQDCPHRNCQGCRAFFDYLRSKSYSVAMQAESYFCENHWRWCARHEAMAEGLDEETLARICPWSRQQLQQARQRQQQTAAHRRTNNDHEEKLESRRS